MILYPKVLYGSQFSGGKKFENPILSCRVNKQKWSLIFFGHPVFTQICMNNDIARLSPHTRKTRFLQPSTNTPICINIFSCEATV